MKNIRIFLAACTVVFSTNAFARQTLRADFKYISANFNRFYTMDITLKGNDSDKKGDDWTCRSHGTLLITHTKDNQADFEIEHCASHNVDIKGYITRHISHPSYNTLMIDVYDANNKFVTGVSKDDPVYDDHINLH